MSDLLTNDDTCGKIYEGVVIEGERVLLYYRDNFGKLCSRHLMHCTPTRIVEWRMRNIGVTCSLGTVEVDDDGHWYLKLPIPPPPE